MGCSSLKYSAGSYYVHRFMIHEIANLIVACEPLVSFSFRNRCWLKEGASTEVEKFRKFKSPRCNTNFQTVYFFFSIFEYGILYVIHRSWKWERTLWDGKLFWTDAMRMIRVQRIITIRRYPMRRKHEAIIILKIIKSTTRIQQQ